MKRLLQKRNPDGSFPFEYRNSASTDVRKTWEEAKRRKDAIDQAQIDANLKVAGVIKPKVKAKSA